MANQVLDIVEMKDNFFANAVMIGIAAAEPGYRLCWILNNRLDTNFINVPEDTICMNAKSGSRESTQSFAFPDGQHTNEDFLFFPTYIHQVPNSAYKYMLYQLKCGKKPLVPEIKHLDFLWLIQTANPRDDIRTILDELRKIPEVQLAQELQNAQLKKSITNLLL